MSTAPLPDVRRTFVYKSIEGTDIEADVLGAEPGKVKPCVMWIHGGGLIFGSRTISPRPSFARALLDRGFVVVSVDHRLAPETKLPAITEDILDAWQWLRECGPELFGADPNRLSIAGASAGGYLALMAGHRITPRPRAVAAFWGYGDITAPWEAEPSSHYLSADLVTRSEAVASLALSPVPTASGTDRSVFYLYCRQQGQWLPEVAGHELAHDRAWFEPYCPLRNIDPSFPATFLIHGMSDTDVPFDESMKLAKTLQANGVTHRFLSLPGVGHGFAGAAASEVQSAEEAVADFISFHLHAQ